MKRKTALGELYRRVFNFIPESRETKELFEKVVLLDNQIRDNLKNNTELLELYDRTSEAVDDMHGEELENYYKQGFRFGLLMGLELTEKE